MLLLAKIQSEKYINDLYSNEYLYFKCLKDFRGKNTDKFGRLDPKELNVKNVQITNFSLSIENREIASSKISPEFNAQFMEHLDDPKINCCSLFSTDIEFDQYISEFDERLNVLGDKMLIIHDYRNFFEILDTSLESLGIPYSRKFVTYYNPKTYNGELTLHHKDFAYSYQNEYRILIKPAEFQPIKIPVPGLKDISFIIYTRDIRSLVIRKN
jgi:hypothetical protein